jgi:hypothetical protein
MYSDYKTVIIYVVITQSDDRYSDDIYLIRNFKNKQADAQKYIYKPALESREIKTKKKMTDKLFITAFCKQTGLSKSNLRQ